jgi:hypothetical protein
VSALVTRRPTLACAFLAGVVLALACGELSLDGKQCNERGECVRGYVCDRGLNLCLRIGPENRVTLPDGAVVPISEVTPPASADGGALGEAGAADGGGESGTPPDPPGNSAWVPETSGTTKTLYAVTVLLDKTAIAVGAQGTIVRRDTTGWKTVAAAVSADLHAVASDGSDVWAVGKAGAVVRSPDGGKTFFAATSGRSNDLRSVDLVAGEIFVGGSGGLFLRGVVAESPDFVSENLNSSETMVGLYAPAANDVYIVGGQGTLHHWQGSGIYTGSGTSSSVTAGFGAGPASFWAVGGRNIIAWTGSGPAATSTISAVNLNGVWASSSARIMTVGVGGAIYVFLPVSGWVRETSGTTADLYGVGGLATSDFYAVGVGGTIVRRN